MPKKETPQEMTYEKALSRLEEIVEHLERGDIPLDESLSNFSEGIKLSRLLSGKLKKAEEDIKKLVEREAGNLEIVPFEAAEGD